MPRWQLMMDPCLPQDFLTGKTPLTLADICLFPYTHVRKKAVFMIYLKITSCFNGWINTIKGTKLVTFPIFRTLRFSFLYEKITYCLLLAYIGRYPYRLL